MRRTKEHALTENSMFLLKVQKKAKQAGWRMEESRINLSTIG